MGIPPGYGFKQLLFSPKANAVVLQAQSAGNNWRPERLYFRLGDSVKYKPIGQPDALESQEFPFVHPSKPLLADNCLRHMFSLDPQGEERHSADWHSLKVYDLDSGVDIDFVNPDTIVWPQGTVRGWISNIVAFTDSGLFVQAGLEGNRIGYFIAEVGMPTHVLKPVVELPATFM